INDSLPATTRTRLERRLLFTYGVPLSSVILCPRQAAESQAGQALACDGIPGQGLVSWVVLAAAVVAGPEPASRWSARSAARTYDLDAGEDRRRLGGENESV